MKNISRWLKEVYDSSAVKIVAGSCGLQKAESLLKLLGGSAVHIDFEGRRSRRLKSAEDVMTLLGRHRWTGRRDIVLNEPARVRGHSKLIRELQASGVWNVFVVISAKHALEDLEKYAPETPYEVYRAWQPLEKSRSSRFLESVWNAIYIYDVSDGMENASVRRFSALAEYYSDHIGEVISNRALAKALEVNGNRGCATLLGQYRRRLESSYVIEFADCYNCFERVVVPNRGKVFFCDMGMRNWRFGAAWTDNARRVKLNELYLKLRTQYDKVYYPYDCMEADFVTIGARGRVEKWQI